MFFIRRYLCAAYSFENTDVRELAYLLMDLQIPSVATWTFSTSRKAAVAVLGSLVVLKSSSVSSIEEIWTPNMIYYTGYKVDELVGACAELLRVLVQNMENLEYCVTEKYRSQSQHHGFLRKTQVINADRVRNSIDFL